jgi:GntR family transcriptional regulator
MQGEPDIGRLAVPNMIVVPPMTVNFRDPIPVFQQIRNILAAEIESGELPENEPIPSQAELRTRFKVARGTVAKGVRMLRDEGYVFIVVGRGAWVTPKDQRPRRT